jgi:lantibiotic biosynthesis protein
MLPVWRVDQMTAGRAASPGCVELRPRLTVAASNLVFERDGHLVIGYRSARAADGAPQRVNVRATRPARAALQAAQSPIPVSDLAAQLAVGFPAATRR